MRENYAMIERELLRARALASVLECRRFAERHNAVYTQVSRFKTCAANKADHFSTMQRVNIAILLDAQNGVRSTSNWNSFPVKNQMPSAEVASSGRQERYVNAQERNNGHAYAFNRRECYNNVADGTSKSAKKDSASTRQKQDSYRVIDRLTINNNHKNKIVRRK